MSYATLSDVFIRYKPISTMVGSSQYDVSSDDVSSVFIAQAESYVDGWLARRYVVPLSITPPLITQVTADLAIFNMLAEKSPQVPDFIQKRYDRCESILEKLANGDMVLSNSVSVVTSQGDNYAWSANQDYHPIFDPVLSDLEQAVDQTRVDAAKDARANDAGIDDDTC